jgi:hypothetical protein
MKRAATVCILSVMASGGCATNEPLSHFDRIAAEAIPLCALLADPGPHVGKRVLVRGFLTQDPHSRHFMDEGCQRAILPLNHLQDWPPETDKARRLRLRFQAYADRFHRRPPWVPAVYSGILKDHSPAFIAFADSLSLQDAELEAVGRPDFPKGFRRTD